MTLCWWAGTVKGMDTPNTDQHPKAAAWNAAPKADKQKAKAQLKATLKRLELPIAAALPWVIEAKADMKTGSDFFWGEE